MSDRPRETHTDSLVPAWAKPDIDRVLISEAVIRDRLILLAEEIRRDYRELNPLLYGVLNGSLIFIGDLVRLLDIPLEIAFTQASSYGAGTRPGSLVLGGVDTGRISGRHVLLVDDILDTGRTLCALQAGILEAGPASLRTCVLLQKPSKEPRPAVAEYIGFNIPDEFVVGYGLDFADRYRQLPFVAVMISKP